MNPQVKYVIIPAYDADIDEVKHAADSREETHQEKVRRRVNERCVHMLDIHEAVIFHIDGARRVFESNEDRSHKFKCCTFLYDSVAFYFFMIRECVSDILASVIRPEENASLKRPRNLGMSKLLKELKHEHSNLHVLAEKLYYSIGECCESFHDTESPGPVSLKFRNVLVHRTLVGLSLAKVNPDTRDDIEINEISPYELDGDHEYGAIVEEALGAFLDSLVQQNKRVHGTMMKFIYECKRASTP